MLVWDGFAGRFYVFLVVVLFHILNLLDALLFLYFFCLLQLLSLLFSVLQKDLLKQCDHLLIVFELELARMMGLILAQFVLYLESILHSHTQLLVLTQSLLDAPVKYVVCEAETIFTSYFLD